MLIRLLARCLRPYVPQVAVVIALFTAALVNAMFSGDIQTNSNVWLAAGLGLGLSLRGKLAPVDAAPGAG